MAAFDTYLASMLDRAAAEARADGSATAEAQHLLLAIAADDNTPTGRILASAGLDRGAIREALDREYEHSLSAVGVALSTFALPPATPHLRSAPHLGASIRLALERGVTRGAGRDPQAAHLLLGILRAEVGTVPRALALAGVDRAGLAARVAETLGSAGGGRS